MSEKCKLCEKEFHSDFSLKAHLKDKHHIMENSNKNNNKNYKIIYYFLAIFIIVFIVMAISYLDNFRENSCKNKRVEELFITSHTKTALHIHPNLEIIINGNRQEIPTNIGIEGDIMRAIHTHDSSGKLHVEPPCLIDLTLGDFFKIWGKQFSNKCIFENCVDINKSLIMYVDGKESNEFENLILKDAQEIRIEFKG